MKKWTKELLAIAGAAVALYLLGLVFFMLVLQGVTIIW